MNGKICRGGRTAARAWMRPRSMRSRRRILLWRVPNPSLVPLCVSENPRKSVEAAFEKIRDVSWGEATHPRGTAMSVRTASGFMTRLNLTRIHPRSRLSSTTLQSQNLRGRQGPLAPPPTETPTLNNSLTSSPCCCTW